MENYEEKYKEALEKLQEALAPTEDGRKISGLTRDCIENIFPELKESGDERIRKELISFVRNDGWKFIKLTKEEKESWIAWLEKQKRPEKVNGEDYGIDGLWHAERILEKTLGKVEGYQTDDGILEHKAAITAVGNLHGLKTVEWSKEDEQNFNVVLSYINDEYLRKWLKDIIHTTYDKRIEWSEEDEEWFNFTMDYLDNGQQKWLKSLKQRMGGKQ